MASCAVLPGVARIPIIVAKGISRMATACSPVTSAAASCSARCCRGDSRRARGSGLAFTIAARSFRIVGHYRGDFEFHGWVIGGGIELFADAFGPAADQRQPEGPV